MGESGDLSGRFYSHSLLIETGSWNRISQSKAVISSRSIRTGVQDNTLFLRTVLEGIGAESSVISYPSGRDSGVRMSARSKQMMRPP